MDTISRSAQPPDTEPTGQQPDQATPGLMPSSRVMALALFVILIGMVAGVAYYLGAQDKQMVQTFHPPEKEAWMRPPVTTTPYAAGIAITEEWLVSKSTQCGVDVPLPPRKRPYVIPNDPAGAGEANDKGGYWQFEEQESTMFFFPWMARVIFRNPDRLTEYVAGDVEVFCAPNSAAYTTGSLMQKLEAELPEGISIKKKDMVNLWGQSVSAVIFKGGFFNDTEYYVFATSRHIYLIREIVMSVDPTIQGTTDLIFQNLSFSY